MPSKLIIILAVSLLLSSCVSQPICRSAYVPVVLLETGKLRCVEHQYLEHTRPRR